MNCDGGGSGCDSGSDGSNSSDVVVAVFVDVVVIMSI